MIIKILFPSALSLHCPFFDFISFSSWPFLVLGHNFFYSQGDFGWDFTRNMWFIIIYQYYIINSLYVHVVLHCRYKTGVCCTLQGRINLMG